MRRRLMSWRLLGLGAGLALAAAACARPAAQPTPTETPTGPVTIIHGTTDSIVSLDPAGSYDLGSWQIIIQVMDGLLEVPPQGTGPEPALAESCAFEDPQTYTCQLRQGVSFHDGSEFTAEDVLASIRRNIEINDPNGACSLLAALADCGEWNPDAITTPDDFTVTFHLRQPDATFPFILATPAAFVAPAEYPGDALQPDAQMIGTGRYRLAEYRPGEQVVLEANPDFWGEPPANDRVIVQYFDRSSALKLALEQGEVDLAWRTLTPTETEDLRTAEGVQVLEGPGAEIRYLVFNLKLEPGDEQAVRQAVAMTIDRQAIADTVYEGTVKPLYSMVPEGLTGHIDAFAETYGEAPDPAGAAQVLEEAGIETPVPIEIWWTPTHYGDASADEYAEIERSLEESGLFDVTLKSTEWDQYVEAALTDQYPAYQLGWFPDFVDADNYLAPFYGTTTGFLNNGYSNKRVDKLIADERASTDPAARVGMFEEIQRIVAEEVPIVPVWQGAFVVAVREGVTGVEQTLDPSFQLRYWVIGKA